MFHSHFVWKILLRSQYTDILSFKKVFLVRAYPARNCLFIQPAFQSAMSILRKIPGDKEIVLEQDALGLAARIAGEVAEHERSVVR